MEIRIRGDSCGFRIHRFPDSNSKKFLRTSDSKIADFLKCFRTHVIEFLWCFRGYRTQRYELWTDFVHYLLERGKFPRRWTNWWVKNYYKRCVWINIRSWDLRMPALWSPRQESPKRFRKHVPRGRWGNPVGSQPVHWELNGRHKRNEEECDLGLRPFFWFFKNMQFNFFWKTRIIEPAHNVNVNSEALVGDQNRSKITKSFVD